MICPREVNPLSLHDNRVTAAIRPPGTTPRESKTHYDLTTHDFPSVAPACHPSRLMFSSRLVTRVLIWTMFGMLSRGIRIAVHALALPELALALGALAPLKP